MKYYLSYDHVGSHGPVQMQVIPYDPSNGVRVVGNNTFLYHGSLIVSTLNAPLIQDPNQGLRAITPARQGAISGLDCHPAHSR